MANWQDWVFSIGSWIFIISLIPTIRGKQKPELSTSITTAVILSTFVITYFSLGLLLSAISTSGTAFGWFILAYQRYSQNKK